MVSSTMTSPCVLSGSFWTCGLTLANGHQALAVWYTVFQSAATANSTPAHDLSESPNLAGHVTPEVLLPIRVNVVIDVLYRVVTTLWPIPIPDYRWT